MRVRCNNCMTEYDYNEELELLITEKGDLVEICEKCGTMEYLIDIED